MVQETEERPRCTAAAEANTGTGSSECQNIGAHTRFVLGYFVEVVCSMRG
jgi:hypothetical protein